MTITETLRQAIKDSGLSLMDISRVSKVPYPYLMHFVHGKNMSLPNIELLTKAFHLILLPVNLSNVMTIQEEAAQYRVRKTNIKVS